MLIDPIDSIGDVVHAEIGDERDAAEGRPHGDVAGDAQREEQHAVVTSPEGRAVLPTFHPAYLLRNPDAKRETWLDLQLAAKTLGIKVPDSRPA